MGSSSMVEEVEAFDDEDDDDDKARIECECQMQMVVIMDSLAT